MASLLPAAALQARADEQLFSDMIRINFTGASNTAGSITVSATHAVHLLTGPMKSAEAAGRVDDCECVLESAIPCSSISDAAARELSWHVLYNKPLGTRKAYLDMIL